ncbi:MAG TPA: DUF305 domain-containing protein [Aeromicrobium sp.]|nr:DUF305 domain-containing protein [Aeromicrobium sp.]
MTGRGRLAALVLVLGGALLGLGVGLALRPQPQPRPGPAGTPGPVDIGFAQDMVVHHGQAILMAELASGHAHSRQLKVLARQILLEQAGERGMLQGWLALWGAPQVPSGPPMQWMPRGSYSHAHGGVLMPGMATPDELRELAERRGNAFDREFTMLMIRHHDGGIAMAQAAIKGARLPETRSLAAAMVQAQAEEIATLRRLAGG